MKRAPTIFAGLMLVVLLVSACGSAVPSESPVDDGPPVSDESTAAQPKLMYFYADW